MKHRMIFLIGLVILIAGSAATVARAGGKNDLAKVKAATARFNRVEVAQAAGWGLVPGLDHCFENGSAGAMGFHYINTDLLDLELNPVQPEAMVYAPGKNGKLQLAAVEYIVPAEPWDAENSEPPSVLGRSTHLNESLGVYVLHAWIFKNNPAGMFEDWNPNVSCP